MGGCSSKNADDVGAIPTAHIVVAARFRIGQRVECRDRGEIFHRGVVTSIEPLKVKKDIHTVALRWDEVVELSAEAQAGEAALAAAVARAAVADKAIKKAAKGVAKATAAGAPDIFELITDGNEAAAIEAIRKHPVLARQADPAQYDATPLHRAAVKFMPALVDVLIEAFPDGAKARDYGGNLPLHAIAGHSNDEAAAIAKALLDANPEGAGTAENAGGLPMHNAKSGSVVQIVLVAAYKKIPPLHAAARYGSSVEIVATLLRLYPEGAAAKNEDGLLALQLAKPDSEQQKLLFDKSGLEAMPRAPSKGARANAAIEFGGRCVPGQRFFIASFCGVYELDWDVTTASSPFLSISCVFFPDGSELNGAHANPCLCAELYGPGESYFEEEYGSDKWANSPPEYNRFKAPWGCAWAAEWLKKTHECVAAGQQAVVIYKEGQTGIDTTEGLGHSQRGEVKMLRKEGIEFGQCDVGGLPDLAFNASLGKQFDHQFDHA